MSNSTKLDRYKLDTIFAEDRVTNTTYRTDLATGERRTAVQTTWADRRIIGSGGFSIVILQESAGGQSRAVKKLFKGMANINYSHELTVLSRVAEVGCGSFYSEDLLTRHSFFSGRIFSSSSTAGTRMSTSCSLPWNISSTVTLASTSNPAIPAHLVIHVRSPDSYSKESPPSMQ